MKYVLSCLLVGMAMTVFVADANAVVCARGVYRAGCVGPRGAAVVHRPVAGDMSRFLLNIAKRSLLRLMLGGIGLASKNAV